MTSQGEDKPLTGIGPRPILAIVLTMSETESTSESEFSYGDEEMGDLSDQELDKCWKVVGWSFELEYTGE